MFQQKFSPKLRHFLVVKNIEMADRDAVTAFSFKRFAESMQTMLTSLVMIGVTDPLIKPLPFFVEVVDEVDDLCNVRGIFAGKILFTSHQQHHV